MRNREIKIYPQFIGRLGNNLFQLAACIGYAHKHQVGWGIKKGYIEKGFNVNQIDKYFPHFPPTNDSFRRYQEPKFGYQEIPFFPQGLNIVGFFQSIKYFEHCQDEVRSAINLKYVDGYKDYVAIHVRRGDYASNPGHFPPVSVEYVDRALRKIEEIQGKNWPKVMFISDDVEWCRRNFSPVGPSELYFSEGRNEYEDLCLMASCGHNIIANSTFSWWGAFLNRNPEKIIVSPHHTQWFGPENGVKDQTQDLIPNNWIQVKV